MSKEIKSNRGRKPKTNDYNSVFAQRLRDLIDERNLTLPELAKQLNTTRQSIGQWKNGDTVPNIIMLKTIAEYFNVSADYLIGIEDCKTHTVSNISDQIGLSEKTIKNLKSMQYPTEDELKKLYGVYADSKNIIDKAKTQKDYTKRKNLNKLFEDKNFIEIITLIITLMSKYELWHEIKCTVYSSDTEWDKIAHKLDETQAHLELLDYIEQTRTRINDFLKKFQSFSIIELYHQLTLMDMLIDDEKEDVLNGND